MIYLLKIEEDGHFHGGPPPKPWVAEIMGFDPKFGLARAFVEPLRDYRDAHTAWSGNVYGVVTRFALRDDRLYEVSRCRGNSSKRYVAREFYLIKGGKREDQSPDEALAWAESRSGRRYPSDDQVVLFRLPDIRDPRHGVGELTGLGSPNILGWVVVDGERRYRLHKGAMYEVSEVNGSEPPQRRLLRVHGGSIERITQRDALAAMQEAVA